MAAAAVVAEQVADVDRGGRVEDVVTHRNGGGVGTLRVPGDLHRDVPLGEQRIEQKTVGVGQVLGVPKIENDDVASKLGALQ